MFTLDEPSIMVTVVVIVYWLTQHVTISTTNSIFNIDGIRGLYLCGCFMEYGDCYCEYEIFLTV